MLSLRQLEYLVAVVDTGSFTRAADQLNVTQPALSHQVRALERQVGGRLLERLPRAVRVTPMGRALLPHARATLAGARRAQAAARQAAGLESGELQVATVYSLSLGLLPPVLREWNRAHGDVHVRLLEYRHADELAESMAAGRADVGVGPVPPGWGGPLREIGVEEFVLVLPTGSPPDDDDGARLDLRSLADRRWVHYAPGHGLADVVDRVCGSVGFLPRAAVRTEQTAAAPVLAAAGLGPALVPANIVPPQFDGVLRWPDPAVSRAIVAYTRDQPDPLTAAFVRTLVDTGCPRPHHLCIPSPRERSQHPPIRL